MQRMMSAVAAVFLLASSAGAQSLSTKVNSELAGFISRNPTYTHINTTTGIMPAQGSLVVQVYLQAGVSYIIRGACDVDCRDVDLSITEPGSSATMRSDYLADDFPVLEFLAPRTGYANVTVSLPSCSTSWCSYGFAMVQRR